MSGECCNRRAAVAAIAGSGLALSLAGTGALAASDPAHAPPRTGDYLVYSSGPKAKKPIAASDLKLGSAEVLAWAMDPKNRIVRNGTRLNAVLVVAVDPSKLSATTKAHAAGGVVAYSAFCTHEGCTVEGWVQARQLLICPCHQSEYDPRREAKVVGGPAPKPLAALPLKSGPGGILTVAGSFIGHVGIAQS